MRRLPVVGLLLVALGFVSTSNAGPRSPWPDPAERAAFQSLELQRHARLVDLIERPETRRTELQDRYDVTYYRLALDLRNVDLQWIFGDLDAHLLSTADSLDTILFDLNEQMQVDSVYVNGALSGFTHETYDLAIETGKPVRSGEVVRVRVFYQGHPIGTGLGSFGWAAHNGTPLIWSLSEPDGAREWWPCKDRPDDKADSLDVLLRVDDWLVATSNGLLVRETDEGDGSRSFHWRHRYPISTYLVSVTATNYLRLEDTYHSSEGEAMLIEHFVYPEKLSAAQEDFSITPEAIEVFSERFGPYPFLREKYGHSLFPFSGGMEHQTNTSYGGGLINGMHLYDWILVHELAHQWWGDMTSPADWRDIWLNEGFASYAEALWFEHRGGFEDYRAYMVNVQSVFDPSGPLYDPPALFDPNTVYNKGAWAVHMLRGAIGDSLFLVLLDEYRSRTAYSSTTTAEFQSIAEEVVGEDLDWFFDPWIYGVDRPQYEVSFLPTYDSGLPGVVVHLDQVQRSGLYFPMPVVLEIEMEGGGFVRKRVWNDEDHEDFEFDLPVPPVRVEFDPDDWILKWVETSPYAMHITTTDLPHGAADSLYETRLRGRGGDPPYVWSVVDPLPGEMALDSGSGTLSGRAPAGGSYTFNVQLSDTRNRIDTQRFLWTVTALPDSGIVEPPDSTDTGATTGLSMKVGPIPAHQWAIFDVEDSSGGDLTLTIFDIRGRRTRDLWDGPAPSRTISWNGKDARGEKVPSGVYLARVRSRDREVTRRVVWLWAK